MLRPWKLATAATSALLAVAAPALAGGSAQAAPASPTAPASPRWVNVAMSNKGFTFPTELRAGFVTFAVTTKDPNGHTLQGVKLRKGVTLAKLVADIKNAVSNTPPVAAAGIRGVAKDAILVGGAAVEPSTQVDDTMPLWAGTYYFFDFNAFFVPGGKPPVFHKVEVDGRFHGSLPAFGAEIDQVNRHGLPRFAGPSSIDPADWILVRNMADEPHEISFQRVNKGITNAKLTTFFNAISQGKNPGFNPFAENAARGLAPMSPGRFQLVRFFPKAGHYAVLCFIPDDKSGIPHAFLGMHKIVRLS